MPPARIRRASFPAGRDVASATTNSSVRQAPLQARHRGIGPRTATRIGTGDSTMRRISPWMPASIASHWPGRCSSTLAPKLKCGTFRIEQNARRDRHLPRCSRARSSAAIMAASIRFAFGRLSRSRNSLPVASEPNLERAHVVPALTSPRALVWQSRSSVLRRKLSRPVATRWPPARGAKRRNPPPVRSLGTLVEGAESRSRLRHHVEGEPSAGILLVAVPGVELGLA